MKTIKDMSEHSRPREKLQEHGVSAIIEPMFASELEAERALVESNRKLIEVFERKIQAKLNEIWDCGS